MKNQDRMYIMIESLSEKTLKNLVNAKLLSLEENQALLKCTLCLLGIKGEGSTEENKFMWAVGEVLKAAEVQYQTNKLVKEGLLTKSNKGYSATIKGKELLEKRDRDKKEG